MTSAMTGLDCYRAITAAVVRDDDFYIFIKVFRFQ